MFFLQLRFINTAIRPWSYIGNEDQLQMFLELHDVSYDYRYLLNLLI